VTTDSVTLLTAEDPEWETLVDRAGGDFYHRRGYHGLAHSRGDGRAFLVAYGNEQRLLAWPYLLRQVPDSPSFDVTSVYGYAGPLTYGLEDLNPGDTDAFLGSAWSAVRSTWAEQGAIAAFTVFHPLLENARLARRFEAGSSGPLPAIARLGRTASIDLGPSRDERLAAYEKETRYQIGRARRHGFNTALDTGLEHLDDLAYLYTATMRRNGASNQYFFTREYFTSLVEALGDRCHLMLTTFDSQVVGALLFVVDGPFAAAHLTGVSEEHLRLSPLNLMLDATADAAKALGARWLHLGAGRGGFEDSLFAFKRRIGTVERDFSVGRWVIDDDAYRALAGKGSSSPSAQHGDFFPAYRAPRP